MTEGAILGIDTSGAAGSVAVLLGETQREIVFSEGLIHGVALAPNVARILAEAGVAPDGLRGIGVGLGPGSYTGVRVGVAFAKTLAFATGVPVAGVSSLRAMAGGAPDDRTIVCVRDARRGTLYLEIYGPGRRPERPLSLVTLDEVTALLPPGALVIGDATERFADLLSGDGRDLGGAELGRSSATVVARLARDEWERGVTVDVHDLSPIYLRPSEAEERAATRGDA